MTQKMSEDDERIIFEQMMETYGFHETANGVTCDGCGKRFQKHAIGLPINERMIKHFEEVHNRREEKKHEVT